MIRYSIQTIYRLQRLLTIIIFSLMLKPAPSVDLLYGQQPRKRVKLNVVEDQNYNEFKGDFYEDPENLKVDEQREKHQEKRQKFENFQVESNRYQSIYEEVKVAERKIRKIKDVANPPDAKQPNSTVKIQAQKPENAKKQSKEPKSGKKQSKKQLAPNAPNKIKAKNTKQVTGISNWQKFMNQSSTQKSQSTKKDTCSIEAVAIDCQFVKSGQQQLLARISIVGEKGQCLLDSYVRPQAKITDYITQITGISYLHIKNAPLAKVILDQAKKIMYNKIVVGHTVMKDLEVCGLKNWKGWKALVDIAEFNDFKQKNGRLISLRNLSFRHLGRSIQEGHHSSVEDATATLDLYKLRRLQILKQFKVIV